MTIDDNMVRYYFGANKNLTELSNALEHMSLRPIDNRQVQLPDPTTREMFVMFVSDGNVLDLKERMSINRQTTLRHAVFTIRKISLTDHVYGTADLLFLRPNDTYSLSGKTMFALPGHLLAVNFRENEKYGYQKFTKHLDIKKSLHILRNDEKSALMEVQTYPYLPRNAYLDLSSYDFDKHSFIVGASGSGKSKFIELFVDRLVRSPYANQYRVVVIDPHASLEGGLRTLPGAEVLNFRSNADSTELFAETNTDISASAELTSTLLKSLLGASYTPIVERVVRNSLTILMTAQVMSLANLKRFLSDATYRADILQHVGDYISDTAQRFFTTEYETIVASRFDEVVAPIIELIDEIDARSGVHVSSQTSSLAQVVSANPLTVFSLNKISMGEKVVKTVSGLLIQQLFLLAQARQFQEKIILIIDEVSVIQNPTIAQILAEARKYNLFVFLTQQYFGQVEKPLQDAIFSNVSNYYVFKVSEVDARALEGNITMELPRKMIMEATMTIMSEEDKRVPILTSLDPRECVVRVSSGGKILPAFKARTVDFEPAKPTDEPNVTLTSYTKQPLPKKYTETHDTNAKLTAHNKPEAVPEPVDNLMQVLSKQSSRRNRAKGKS